SGCVRGNTTRANVKRKATSAPAGKKPTAKQQKLVPLKEEKKERAGGWLQEKLKQRRTEKKEMKFNKKRLRFVSDTEKIKQGSEGVLYWMSRDHRVQGEHTPSSKTIRHLVCLNSFLVLLKLQDVIDMPISGSSLLNVRLKAQNFPHFFLSSPFFTSQPVDWDKTLVSLQVDRTVGEPEWATPGTKGGIAMLESFIDVRLKLFDTKRNDPNADALSHLSPWIRFGHLSAQRVALQVQHSGKKAGQSVSSFIEELVVRRELTDNFCFYNKKYDSASEWAQKTLEVHAEDNRPYLYTRQQLEEAKTHDKLWNAAQYQMVSEGKMHGFLRMYWAKKILEWTSSPKEALSIALYLNDRYELDGQDPNGFVGCMWSICGIHDQGWRERAVFGKIRYMNYKGCTRKFDVAQFERKYCPKKL
uniref:Deoxyribodipyrimidine photo-lyase n=1 Tax=Seriola lalandi dorsalis TaxID=1841481 RepID=A0A3B4XTU0_SERLL